MINERDFILENICTMYIRCVDDMFQIFQLHYLNNSYHRNDNETCVAEFVNFDNLP